MPYNIPILSKRHTFSEPTIYVNQNKKDTILGAKMTYRNILEKLRLAFPQPVSNTMHDSYFVHSMTRALDQVDALKTHLPMLDSIVTADFEAAKKTELPETISSVEEVTTDLVSYLRGMTIFGHPRTQQNVIGPHDNSESNRGTPCFFA